MKNIIHLQFSRRLLYMIAAIIFLVNVGMLAATYFLYFFYYQVPQQPNLVLNLSYFNLAQENTLGTCYSALLLLAVSIVAAFCFVADRQYYKNQPGRFFSYGWLFISSVFGMLSLDEVGSFHERIGNNASFNLFGEFIDWYLYKAAIVGVAVFMLLFCWVRLRSNIWASILLLAGLALFISLRFQENYEFAHYSFKRPVFFIILEEGSEIFGSFCFLIAMTLSWINLRNKSGESQKNILIDLKFNLSPNLAVAGTFLLLFLLALSQLFIEIYFKNFALADKGIPENWFPGATAFFAAVISFIIYFNVNSSPRLKPIIYLLSGFFCLFISLVYGSSFYHIYFYDKAEWLVLFIKILFGGGAIALAFKFMAQIDNSWSWAGLSLWAVLFCTSLIVDNFYFARIGYVSFACLLLALIPHLYRWQHQAINPESKVLNNAS